MAGKDSTRAHGTERTTRERDASGNGKHPVDTTRLARVIFDAANRSLGNGAKRLTMATAEAIARIAGETTRVSAAEAALSAGVAWMVESGGRHRSVSFSGYYPSDIDTRPWP